MTLNMLAECHLLAGRDAAARRSALEASRLSQRNGLESGRGYAALFLGRVAENRGQDDLAESRWREAVSIARGLENKRLEFSAEFYLYRRAVRTGMQRRSEAGRRRLERLAPWVPEHLPLRIEFQEMSAEPTERSSRRPARRHVPESPRPSRVSRSGEWGPRNQREERP
jgi:hypothetical protein